MSSRGACDSIVWLIWLMTMIWADYNTSWRKFNLNAFSRTLFSVERNGNSRPTAVAKRSYMRVNADLVSAEHQFGFTASEVNYHSRIDYNDKRSEGRFEIAWLWDSVVVETPFCDPRFVLNKRRRKNKYFPLIQRFPLIVVPVQIMAARGCHK